MIKMDAIDIVVKVFHDLMSFHLFSLDQLSLCANINCIYNCSTQVLVVTPQEAAKYQGVCEPLDAETRLLYRFTILTYYIASKVH